MIDFHSHILPQTDDGPVDITVSVEMAKILANVGFTDVCCTPHMFMGAYENDPIEIRNRVTQLQELLDRNDIKLRLSPGAEYYLDEYLPVFIADPLPLASCCILAESPLKASLQSLEFITDLILSRGYTPLIAHPERTPLFASYATSREKNSIFSPVRKFFSRGEIVPETMISAAITRLVGKGCRLQGNIGSFAGIYGKNVRSCALDLLDEGLYSCLGSDAHRPELLEETLQNGLATIRNRIGAAAADRLLSGELLPAGHSAPGKE